MMILRLILLLATLGLPALSEPMTFRAVSNGGNCAGCGWTVAQGEITPDTPTRLQSHLAEVPYTSRIVFDSPGGNLGGALELGRLIREAGLATGIGRSKPVNGTPWYEPVPGGTCDSACAFAFLGGTARYAMEDPDDNFAPRMGRLGMHQFYTPNGQNIPSTDTQQIMGQVLLYMLDIGANAELLTIAARTPPDQMYYFSREELRALGVLTTAGSDDRGLFLDNGGLATGWSARHDNGTVDRTITLRCSAGANGWVLRVRDHGNAPTIPGTTTTGFNTNDPAGLVVLFGGQRNPLPASALLSLIQDGPDHVLEVLLPRSTPAFAGQDFSFHTNNLRNFQMVLGASETLPDAETFSVLARACGD